MFFMNAEDLGEEFFTGPHEIGNLDSYNLATDSTHKFASRSVLMFGAWVTESLIPIFNEANPTRHLLPIKGTADCVYTAGVNYDVHRDSPWNHRDRTYVTLGLSTPGKKAGTLFPIDSSAYKGKSTSDIPTEMLEREFVTPPEKYVAVFDPDLERHAAPPFGRLLFKASFGQAVDVEYNAPRLPIACPDSTLCIDALRLFRVG